MQTYVATTMTKAWFSLVVVGLVLTLAACGGPSTTTTSAGTTPTAAPTATPTPSPTATPIPAPPVVKTGTATTKSGSKTVLTNAQGLTLYYFDPDTATTAACTGACAQAWPPLLFAGSGQPTAAGSLPGQLTVVKAANGMQVAYNGHLLYTFKEDEKPGTAEGDGLLGKWHVATPDLQAK
jgi:predicted lipoprotein with Yx(FWY)xxD motif